LKLAKRVLVGAVWVLALASAGCGKADFDHAEIDGIKPSPLGGNMSYARIEVPVGMIVVAHITAYDEDKKTMAVSLKEKETNIVSVTNVVTEHDYAFWGNSVGETEIEMRANDKLVLIVKARVIAQPTP
jgi:hypothetical protein